MLYIPLPEAIMTLLQEEIEALKQVERASMHFFQVLERQAMEVETLISRVKEHRDIPKPMKKSYKEQYWWSFVAGDVKVYREQWESYRTWLEEIQKKCDEKLAAFKQLQEEVDNLYPQ